MSDRSLFITHTPTALQLAVHLGREEAGVYMTAERVSNDVQALMRAGVDAKQALETGQSPDCAYDAAVKVAQAYRAQVIRSGEVDGVSLGLRFWSPRSGHPGFVFCVS